MGRKAKPIVTRYRARAQLAHELRLLLLRCDGTYEQLAKRTPGISRVTLQRAASGTCLPKEKTVVAFVHACGFGRQEVAKLTALRISARIEERGVLHELKALHPRLISDRRDLSRALEYVYEAAGAPTLRELRDRSGEPLLLPISTLSRIVSRRTTPVDERQLLAFIHGCGITHQDSLWSTAWKKVAMEVPDPGLQSMWTV
ncbi:MULTISPECIES: helix-turn-helix domain-containing protein [unclassified Streptomyces]|uniref:helix-turn-helix domain-containing protein n=1 Tax=unclassified Streptomyces TaxID=2593676 RepID=UPI0033AAE43C